ncbi:hypothetical protein D6833_00045 [Candidatus Parcubacteria bacterium]|nr:MAG: hypothetical protein D6833_00045 [Candidatus Parcubacteria bacterium]
MTTLFLSAIEALWPRPIEEGWRWWNDIIAAAKLCNGGEECHGHGVASVFNALPLLLDEEAAAIRWAAFLAARAANAGASSWYTPVGYWRAFAAPGVIGAVPAWVKRAMKTHFEGWGVDKTPLLDTFRGWGLQDGDDKIIAVAAARDGQQ